MASSRRFVPALLGAFLAGLAACKDPLPTTGSLILDISGIPAGGAADVRVTGPNDYFKVVASTTTLEDLAPGDYFIRIDTITHAATRYGVAAVRDTFAIVVGQTQTADINYAIASGSITMTVTGLPVGTNADIKLVAPGFSATVTASGVVGGLPPGKIYIHADTFFTTQGDRLGSAKVLDSVTIPASLTPVPAAVAYSVVSATLTLTVNGMPPTLPLLQQPITVSGPNGYQIKTSATGTTRGLVPGTYSVSAVNANGTCPTIYKTSPATQSFPIAAGATGTATVNYTEGPADPAELNLRIEKVHLIQVTQDEIGSVPMVANKSALVRVFAVANQCNVVTPQVRVTLGSGDVFNITAPEEAVRYKTETGSLLASWNATIPANLVQPGMTVVAEMDATNAVAETNESDNRFPASSSLEVAVKTVPTIGLRIVPLVNGNLTGDIGTDLLMDLPRKLHPIPSYDISVRTPYTTTTGALSAGGGNWEQVLFEVNALRTADNSNRYYYGIARVAFESGTAGIGFIQGKAALGWDHVLTASEVAAHELGHNFGRFHAPSGSCGQMPSQVDLSYPTTGLYVGGKIGVYGYDPVANQLKSPEIHNDIMGYCRNVWISDYMYVGMMNYLSDPNREATLPRIVPSGPGPVPALLVWGRIVNGQPVLEPAFEITAAPEPIPAGPHRLSAVDERGNEVFSFSFAAHRVSHGSTNEGFAFAVPLSRLGGRTLASLRVTSRGRTASSVVSSALAADPGLVATRTAPGRVRLRWDASRFPVLMVRDQQSGDVISFARGGDVSIAATRDDLEVSWSNRIRSARRGVRVPR